MHLSKSRPEFPHLRPWRGALTAALAIGLGVGVGAPWIAGAPATGASSDKGKTLTVSASANATFGTILVSGTTLYTLTAGKVACTAQCRHVWHQLDLPRGVKRAKAGHGVSSAKLGTKKRGRGVVQVTYGGKALYWFVGDTAAGQVNGNVTDTWGRWSVVVTAKPVRAAQPLAPGPTTSTTSPPAPTTAPPPTSPAATPTISAPMTTPTSRAATPAPEAPTTTTSPPPLAPLPPPPTTTTTTTAPGSGGVSF